MNLYSNLFVLMLALVLSPNSISSAVPTLIGTYYFYVGDQDCTHYTLETLTVVHCFDSENEYTGVRQAMTDEQLDLYNNYRGIKAE